jgi:type IV pilus assembly protein PilQ
MRDFTLMRHSGTRLVLVAIGVGLLFLAAGYVSQVTAAESVSGGLESTALSQNEMPEQSSGAEIVRGSEMATVIDSVDLQSGRVVVNADGKIDKYRFFSLADPSRLVVDLYAIRPTFTERTFTTQGGFNQVRVGPYEDRTRFVFDSDSQELPAYSVGEIPNGIVVSWGGDVEQPSHVANAVAGKISVDEINFQKDNGKSQLIVKLSAPGQIIPATVQGNIVRFGVKNADIHRSLRRTFDSSAFPSSVLRVTPYTAMFGNRQDVFFAVELKGQVSYQLLDQGSRIIFIADDGAFVDPVGTSVEQFPVPVAASAVSTETSSVTSLSADSGESAGMVIAPARSIGGGENEPVYVGQKVRLEFDDADLRDIFRLIAEVSDLNIIVSDDVKGAITLRLIDVPWDQALALILEVKNLGLIKKGNVVRILPKGQIRSMEEAKFTAARNKEKLEDLVTEVIAVSYTDLKNVEKPSKELLTGRGKITADNRNKQLIVTDIASVIDSIKKLISILDTPERQVLIEARIVEVSSTFNRNLGVSWNFLNYAKGEEDYDRSWKTLGNGIGVGGNYVIPPAVAGSAAGLGSSITFGKLMADGVGKQLDLTLSAMEASGYGKIISRPRITTLNGETAKISQGTMIPYQTVSDNVITTELVEAALSLEVTPVINPDNSVILEIKATNSSPGTTVATGAGAAPSIDSKEAETKVLVRDGETTVIGGIFVEKEDFSENGVPILRSIPFFGHLFKSSQKTNPRSELLIFITPRILN